VILCRSGICAVQPHNPPLRERVSSPLCAIFAPQREHHSSPSLSGHDSDPLVKTPWPEQRCSWKTVCGLADYSILITANAILGLDDLCVRFIINLPQEDLSTVARICFQVEEAQWFYEDFVRPLDPSLPTMSLKTFCLRIFQHCPLLASFSVENHTKAFEEFLQYKIRVPVRGAILLNEAMDSTVLVKGWKKGASWSFPRGKINKDEDDLDCAIREVYEETGFDIRTAGLVPQSEDVKYIEITMREQQMRLYVFRNIPMDTHFQPRTRKEISKIEWYKLSQLPAFRKKGSQSQVQDTAAAANANKFYMVAPFLVPLKKWVVQQKKKDAMKAANESHVHLMPHSLQDEVVTEDDAWAHTEPAPDPAIRTPAIDTLEGATRELQRLLKVQPSTQGLQVNLPSESSQNKGGALLAILQAKSSGNESQAPLISQGPVPKAPLDHTAAKPPPAPHAPHQHHQAQRIPLSSYQQPPHLPIMHTAVVTAGAPWGAMQQPYHGALPPQYLAPEEPVMVTQQRPKDQPTLLHPQPLPPQVQKSLLSKGMLRETPPPAYAVRGSVTVQVPNMTGTQGYATSPYAEIAMTQQSQPNPAPKQLAEASAALLSSFKGGAALAGTSLPRGIQGQAAGATTLQSQVSTHQSYYTHQQYQGGSSVGYQMALQSMGVPMNMPAASRPAPPSDKHRSALLDMFKKADSSVAASPDGSQASAIGTKALTGQPGSASSNRQDPQLPFAALSLQSKLQGAASPSGSMKSSQLSDKTVVPAKPGPGSQHGHSNSGLGRKENTNYRGPAAPSSTGSPYTAVGQDAPASWASPPAASALPMPGALGRRTEASTEQRQRLLALFGTKEPGEDKGKGKDVGLPDPTPRSRVASLASGAAEGQQGSVPTSRRESETPISPADRNFLLGYLESVANNAAR
jgi:mRNA-decapping enzyme subunit 2